MQAWRCLWAIPLVLVLLIAMLIAIVGWGPTRAADIARAAAPDPAGPDPRVP